MYISQASNVNPRIKTKDTLAFEIAASFSFAIPTFCFGLIGLDDDEEEAAPFFFFDGGCGEDLKSVKPFGIFGMNWLISPS